MFRHEERQHFIRHFGHAIERGLAHGHQALLGFVYGGLKRAQPDLFGLLAYARDFAGQFGTALLLVCARVGMGLLDGFLRLFFGRANTFEQVLLLFRNPWENGLGCALCF